jgi:hypothetical protein
MAFRASRPAPARPERSASSSDGQGAVSAARAAPWGRLDVHPRVAMRIRRHSKITVTMEIYTEAPSDATRDALRRLSDWLA